MKKRITTIAILAASVVLATTGIATAWTTAPHARTSENIVQVASEAPQFSTLVSLIKKAGLEETLSGTEPFTVLAPTNAAFNRLPRKTLKAIAGNPTLLMKVLTYHVIPGTAMAADVVKLNGTRVTTVEGDKVSITVRNHKVFINNTSTVITTDIEASNGVMHAISKVLVPKSVLNALSH